MLFSHRLLLAGLGALALDARAVTLDFEALTRGALITNQLQSQGVLFSAVDNTNCCHPGTVLDVSLGDQGVFNFGGSGKQALVYGIPTDQLNIDFVLPNSNTATVWDSVSLRVGDGDAVAEIFRVTFKGLAGNVLNVQEFTTGGGPVGGGATVSFNGAGIHRVEVLGLVGASGGAIDDLSFSSAVPEPGSWALLLGGLAGVAARRARRLGQTG